MQKKLYSLTISFICAAILSTTISAQTSTIVREATNSFKDVTSIKVDGQFAKIDIEQISGTEVQFSGKLISDKKDEAYQLINTVTNGILNIVIQFPAQGWTTHSGEIFLKVPAGVNIDIITTSGSTKINNIDSTSVKIVSKSGSVDCTNSKGSFYFESITGTIKVDKCGGKLDTKSKSGNHFLTNLNGQVNANSTEGEINISQVTGNIKTESTKGNQTIGFIVGNVTSKAVNGMIKVSETKGNISILTFAGPQKLFKTTGLVNLQSTTGEQVGTRVMFTGSSSFTSTEGKIKIQIDNTLEEMTFDLESESAYIQARTVSKKKKLKMGKGPIVITGRSTTGGQIYN